MNKVVFDTDRWTYRDFVDYGDAHSEHDFERLSELCASIITEWDEESGLSPKDPESYEELDFPTMLGVFRLISEEIKSLFNTEENTRKKDKKSGKVKFDFKRWKYRDFMKLQQAQEDNDADTVQELILKAVESWSVCDTKGKQIPVSKEKFNEMCLSDYIDLMNDLVIEVKRLGGEGN